MEIRRGHLLVVGGIGVGIAALLVGDALIVTDEEKLEGFVEAVTGEVSATRVGAALEWVDPASAPVEITAWGDTRLYEDAAELRERAQSALRPFHGERLRALRDSISVEDGTADVSLQLLSGRGLADIDFRLEERDGRWLVTRVRLH
jgi:hypothetical protein